MRRLWPFALVSLAACGGAEPPPAPAAACEASPEWGRGGAAMLPGTDCLECHRPEGRARSRFSVGGTLFGSSRCPTPAEAGASVHVKDMQGRALVLRVNEVGNFYSAQALTPPLQVAVEREGRRVEMKSLASTGACASCHRADAALGLVASP